MAPPVPCTNLAERSEIQCTVNHFPTICDDCAALGDVLQPVADQGSCPFAPALHFAQHLRSALSGGANDEDVPEPRFILTIPDHQLLHFHSNAYTTWQTGRQAPRSIIFLYITAHVHYKPTCEAGAAGQKPCQLSSSLQDQIPLYPRTECKPPSLSVTVLLFDTRRLITLDHAPALHQPYTMTKINSSMQCQHAIFRATAEVCFHSDADASSGNTQCIHDETRIWDHNRLRPPRRHRRQRCWLQRTALCGSYPQRHRTSASTQQRPRSEDAQRMLPASR